MSELLQAGKPGIYSGFDEKTGLFKKMGLGSFVKKIVKAPAKAVGSVAKSVGNLGSAVIDTGTSVVKGTAQVPKDIYSGSKKAIGSVSRGVEKIGAGATEGASQLLSDPLILGAGIAGYTGAIPASQAFAVGAGSLALKSIGSSGAFVDPSGNVISINPNTGQPQIIQTPMGLPGSQPVPFQQSFRSGNDDQSAFDFTNLLPVAIGGLGLYILLRGRK